MQPDRREQLFKVLLIGAIVTMAGPEIFPAIEMVTLLELLGAALFVSAFGAALRLLVHEVARWLVEALVPSALVALYRQTTPLLKKTGVAGYLCLRALHILMMAVVCIAYAVLQVR